MLNDAKFYEALFSKAKSKGFKFIHSDEGFIVSYPGHSQEQSINVNTDEQFSKVVLDIFNWK